jgi:hypothetical protein
MDYQIERRRPAIGPAAARLTAVRCLNPLMTCVIAAGTIGEGFWLARDPRFAIGGAVAGAAIAIGALGIILGLSWLSSTLRNRR